MNIMRSVICKRYLPVCWVPPMPAPSLPHQDQFEPGQEMATWARCQTWAPQNGTGGKQNPAIISPHQAFNLTHAHLGATWHCAPDRSMFITDPRTLPRHFPKFNPRWIPASLQAIHSWGKTSSASTRTHTSRAGVKSLTVTSQIGSTALVLHMSCKDVNTVQYCQIFINFP